MMGVIPTPLSASMSALCGRSRPTISVIALDGDAPEGRLAVAIAAVNVGTVLQQHLGRFEVVTVAEGVAAKVRGRTTAATEKQFCEQDMRFRGKYD